MRRLIPFLLLSAGCGGKASMPDPVEFHGKALAATEPSALGAPAPGSEAQKAAVERFRAFWSELTEQGVKARVREVYADDVWFNDTVKSIRGVEALEHYLVETARSVESCKVAVEEVVPAPGGVYVRWRMDILLKRFRKGEVQRSIGVTLLRLDKDGRVAYHQDFWDSGTNLYEKIPVLGAGIRAVKRRL